MDSDILIIDFPSEAGRKVQETLMAKGLHGREVTFSEDLLKGLTEELLVFFWQNGVQSKERIIKIRATPGFSDSTLVAVSDEANEERAEEALKYGADYAIALGDASKLMSIMRDKSDRALTFENAPAYVQPFIDSVCNVVSTMAYMDVSPKGIRLQHGHYLHGDISGVMGITGSGPGYIAVCFASDTARKLVAGILGQNPEDLGPADIRDGVYEATNMIAGGTKARLSGTPHHFEMTTPVVVDGVENKYTRLGEIPCLVLLFELEGDPFAVQVCLGRSPLTVHRRIDGHGESLWVSVGFRLAQPNLRSPNSGSKFQGSRFTVQGQRAMNLNDLKIVHTSGFMVKIITRNAKYEERKVLNCEP